MSRLLPRPLQVEQDFTDARLTGFGGCSALALTAERLGLFQDLSEGVRIKVRRRGASDGESLWVLAASLAAGGGSLSDLDGLRSDPAALRLMGLSLAPSGRRMGEFLSKVSESDVEGLLEAARRLARQVASAVVEHEVEAGGFVPVFVDGTEIERAPKGRSSPSTRSSLSCLLVFESIWAFGRVQPAELLTRLGGRAVVGPFLAWPSGPSGSLVATVFPKS